MIPKAQRIKLKREHGFTLWWEQENCCFCFHPTPMWVLHDGQVTGESVPCCYDCAREHTYSQVPSKKKWCADDIRRAANRVKA